MVCGALPGGPANSRSDQLKANAAAGERDVLSSSYRDVRWLTEDDVVQLSPAEILSLLNSCIKKLGKTARDASLLCNASLAALRQGECSKRPGHAVS